MLVSIFNKEYVIENTTIICLNIEDLDFFPLEICKLLNLKKISLVGHKIGKLPASIGNLNKLQAINLSSNLLSTLPPEISNLTKLEKLRLSDNILTTLPAEIGKLVSLKKIFNNNIAKTIMVI